MAETTPPHGTAYYLPELDLVVGQDDDGTLRRRWEDFAASTAVFPHRCNGVTRWLSNGRLVQRITCAVEGLNSFKFVDEVVSG